jgi:hypothetical protein
LAHTPDNFNYIAFKFNRYIKIGNSHNTLVDTTQWNFLHVRDRTHISKKKNRLETAAKKATRVQNSFYS